MRGEIFSLANGKLKFYRQGQPSGEDGLWLGACLTPKENDKLLDAGCGNALIMLALKKRCKKITFYGLEKNTQTAYLAQQNIKLNRQNHMYIISGDATRPPFPAHSFDHIVTNPPFHLFEQGFESKSKADIHGIQQKDIGSWIKQLTALTKKNGSISLIHHAENIEVLESFFKKHSRKLIFLQTAPHKTPKRVIMQVTLNSTPNQQKHLLATHDKKTRQDILYQLKPLRV